LIEKLIIVA